MGQYYPAGAVNPRVDFGALLGYNLAVAFPRPVRKILAGSIKRPRPYGLFIEPKQNYGASGGSGY